MRNSCCDRDWNTVSHGYRVRSCFVVVIIPLVCPLASEKPSKQQSIRDHQPVAGSFEKGAWFDPQMSPQTRLFLFRIWVPKIHEVFGQLIEAIPGLPMSQVLRSASESHEMNPFLGFFSQDLKIYNQDYA